MFKTKNWFEGLGRTVRQMIQMTGSLSDAVSFLISEHKQITLWRASVAIKPRGRRRKLRFYDVMLRRAMNLAH